MEKVAGKKVFLFRFYILCENSSKIGQIIKKIPKFWDDPLKSAVKRKRVNCLMLYINWFVSTSSSNLWKVFFYFEFVFKFLAENLKNFKQIARLEYWSICSVLYINGFVSTSSTNWWKLFSNSELVFELLAKKRIIFNE